MSSTFKTAQIRRMAKLVGVKRVNQEVYEAVTFYLEQLINMIAEYVNRVRTNLQVTNISKEIMMFTLNVLGIPVAYEGELEVFDQKCTLNSLTKVHYNDCHVLDRTPIRRYFMALIHNIDKNVGIRTQAVTVLHFTLEHHAIKWLKMAWDIAQSDEVVTLKVRHLQVAAQQIGMMDNYPVSETVNYGTYIGRVKQDLGIELQSSSAFNNTLNGFINRMINRVATIATMVKNFFPYSSRMQGISIGVEMSMSSRMLKGIYDRYNYNSKRFTDEKSVPPLLIPMNRLNEHFKTYAQFGLGRRGYILLDSMVEEIITIVLMESTKQLGSRKRLDIVHLKSAIKQIFHPLSSLSYSFFA